LKNSELLARINSMSKNSIGADSSQISSERAEALDRYNGKPYGDEKEGRSKVVSHALAEAVDWTMPSIMKTFVQGDIVEFLPVSAEDEELAQQESDYLNHVMKVENDPFEYFHDAVKDALIMKNGYWKAYFKESEETVVERFNGMNEEEITVLFAQYEEDECEHKVVSQEERMESIMVMGEMQDMTVFDLVIRVVRKVSGMKIDAIPPEEVRVSRRARGKLNDCDYVEHETKIMRSELIKMGMSKKFVEELPSEGGNEINDQESFARDTVSDENEYTTESMDKTTDQIEYREVYCMVDFDGDGIAERRRIIIAGGKIPKGEEWNQEIDRYGIYHCTPKRMPHRHTGISLNDDIEDLAKIDTVLLRGTLDNTYSQVNQEWLVNERVNLDDFLVSRPNGIKRISDKNPIGDCAIPVPKANILPHVMPVIQHIEKMKAVRTGIQPAITGADPDALKEVREKPANDNMDKANQQIEMTIRMIAQGFKELALGIHADLIKHQDKAKVVRLRNKWVNVNPSEWRNRTDLAITVGLGNGNREETKSTISMISIAQEKLLALGGVDYKHAYAGFSKLAEALGESNPAAYALSPDEHQAKQQQMQQAQSQQPPPVDPIIELEKMKQQGLQQIAQSKIQADMQITQMKLQAEQQLEGAKLQLAMQKDQSIKQAEEQKKLMGQVQAEKARNILAEREVRLEYEKRLFDFEQQEMNGRQAYDESILNLKESVVQLKANIDSVDTNGAGELEIAPAQSDSSEMANSLLATLTAMMSDDAQARARTTETVISELSKPRMLIKDENDNITGIE